MGHGTPYWHPSRPERDAIGGIPSDFDDIAGAEMDAADHIARCGTLVPSGDIYYRGWQLHDRVGAYNPARAKREHKERYKDRPGALPNYTSRRPAILEGADTPAPAPAPAARMPIQPGDRFKINKPGDPMHGVAYECYRWEQVTWSGVKMAAIKFYKSDTNVFSYAKPEYCVRLPT